MPRPCQHEIIRAHGREPHIRRRQMHVLQQENAVQWVGCGYQHRLNASRAQRLHHRLQRSADTRRTLRLRKIGRSIVLVRLILTQAQGDADRRQVDARDRLRWRIGTFVSAEIADGRQVARKSQLGYLRPRERTSIGAALLGQHRHFPRLVAQLLEIIGPLLLRVQGFQIERCHCRWPRKLLLKAIDQVAAAGAVVHNVEG